MNVNFNKSDLKFQQKVRSWIAANYMADLKPAIDKNNGRISREQRIIWQKRLATQGWAAPNWPREFGGIGLTATQKHILNMEINRANAPTMLPFGVSMVAPVIMKFGTQEQKDKYLPDILNSDIWWCQGYSEPGSGSDLASLQCKAEDKGDHYLVNGTKTWTTLAQYADMIFCLVRTSQEAKRQLGISFLLIDMKSPGIEVKPIITLDCPPPGAQEINTVYFQDVRVPKENLVGEEGKGWTCAKYLLEFERGNAYSPALFAALTQIKTIAAAERFDGKSLLHDPLFKNRMDLTEIAIQAMEYTEYRILGRLADGQRVGQESSLLKCRGTELQQTVTELALQAIGNYGLPWNPSVSSNVGTSNLPPVGPSYAASPGPEYMNTRKVSIYAGSNEIQRNIMAKMVLGL